MNRFGTGILTHLSVLWLQKDQAGFLYLIAASQSYTSKGLPASILQQIPIFMKLFPNRFSAKTVPAAGQARFGFMKSLQSSEDSVTFMKCRFF